MVPSHWTGKHVPETAQRASLGLGAWGWRESHKGPCVFIVKVFDLEEKRGASCGVNSFCLVAGGSRDMKPEKMTRHIDLRHGREKHALMLRSKCLARELSKGQSWKQSAWGCF